MLSKNSNEYEWKDIDVSEVFKMSFPEPIKITIKKEYFRKRFKEVLFRTNWTSNALLLEELMKCFDE